MTARPAKQSEPAFIPPCLATLVRQPPDGEQWLHEIKYDGYRVQIVMHRGTCRIFTRNGHDWTTRFGAVVDDLAEIDVRGAVIDGEAVVLDGDGASRFSLLQAELKRASRATIQIMAFDLLHLDGHSLAMLPLLERKALLSKRVESARLPLGLLRYVEHASGSGPEILTEACALGLEGIVSKRADRPYRSGRNGDWTKAKCINADPFVVVGYTTQKGERGLVGALALGFYDDGEIVYAGRVGTGFTIDEARAMHEGLALIHAPTHPCVANLTGEQKRGVSWVQPRFVAQIAYRDVTADGLLRHASFEHFRADKTPREIVRPTPFARRA